ncbi:hypothetical protein ACFX1R_047895 [Malus domestica]
MRQGGEVLGQLDSLLGREETYWRQRLRVQWLHEGDRNTKFFHLRASNRKRKNTIKGLRDAQGVWQDSRAGIQSMVVGYFQNIFHSRGVLDNAVQEVITAYSQWVTPEMNAELLKPYSEEEVSVALFQMHPSKAPGSDGMPPLFFQTFCHVVKHDVVNAIRSFLTSGRVLREACFTHVVLIPKVNQPQEMSQLRPISLCNVIYKIGPKVIANRLKKFFNVIISPHQSAFVPERLIFYNTLVATEIGHFLHNKRWGREGSFALKLDLSKAYDRVEWNFLEAMMLRLGFDSKWVPVVMMCVKLVSYSFLVNGEECGFVLSSRDLRQGDPLSPYLFLLCIEGLSALIAHKEDRGVISGIRICDGAPSVHHLLFANDSFLFGKAKLEECAQVQHIQVNK